MKTRERQPVQTTPGANLQDQTTTPKTAGIAVAHSQTEEFAQRESTIASSPRMENLSNMTAMINAGSAMSAYRSIKDMTGNSPRQLSAQKLVQGINNSPRMVAQCKQSESLFGTAQQVDGAEAPLQLAQLHEATPNNTGLPDNLKSGIESLSGISLDNVNVHYNSSRPAQLNALAYTRGSEVHVAPGQEQHLPHEAWHVVQQAQGRVKPTMQMKGGVLVNDDQGLEGEADLMGAKALQMRRPEGTTTGACDEVRRADQRTGETGDASQRQGEALGATGGKVRLNFLSIKPDPFGSFRAKGASGPYQLPPAPVLQGKFDRKEFEEDIALGAKTGREDEGDRALKTNRTAMLEQHVGKMQETQKHRQETQDVLSQTDNPRSIISTVGMQRPDELAPRFAENSIEKGKEDMPYYHHAQMVMGQYNKYFSPQVKKEEDEAPENDGPLISDKLMKMMLAFHDINKQRSIKTHGKIGEHTDTVTAISEFSRDWGFSANEIRIACEIVGSDPFGDYFKQVADIRGNIQAIGGQEEQNALLEEARARCFRAIVKAARNAGVPGNKMTQFFERYLMFYQSDFSSYMTDSSYQDAHFKPGKETDKKPGEKRDEYHGPDSFTPEFFAREKEDDKTAPLVLSENKKRLEFSSVKKLNQEARALEAMFQEGAIKGNLAKLAPEALIAQSTRKDNQNESQRANMEMSRAQAKERMQHNPYINFEQPVIALSHALTKLQHAAKLSAVVQKIGQLTEASAEQIANEYQVSVEVAATIIRACRALRAMMPRGKSGRDGDEEPNDHVMAQFNDGGVFIRKLLPEANSKGRESVDKDVNTMEHFVLRQPTTPFVMPSTLVKKDVPVNLTNAQEALQHSSGLIYDQNTKIAPSTKEHNESANLARVLTEPVRNRIHDEETWKSVVRPTIGKMGGKSFDTREGLSDKLTEMELRRSGKIPDLSTKELLLEVLTLLGDVREVEQGDFAKALKLYLKKQELPEFIQKQLVHKFQTVQADEIQKPVSEGGSGKKFDKVEVGKRLGYIRLALSEKRQDRDHSIYGGQKDGRKEKPGNRYFREDKKDTKHGSSEAEGFDGTSFQTNEVLMLPEGVDFIRAIYSNGYSITSRLHSLNLTRELMMQSGRLPDLYNYTALEGMSKTSVVEVLDEIHARLKKGEEIAPSSGLVYEKKKAVEVAPKKDEQPKKETGRPQLAAITKKLQERENGGSRTSIVDKDKDEEQTQRVREQRLKDLEAFKGLAAVKNFSEQDKVSGVEKAKKVWMPGQEANKDRGSEPTTSEPKKKPPSGSGDGLDLGGKGGSSGGKKEKEGRPGLLTPYPGYGIPELRSRVVSNETLRAKLVEIQKLLDNKETSSEGMHHLDQLLGHVDWQIAEMEPDPSERAMFASGNGPNPAYPNMGDANVAAYNMWLFFRELMDLRDRFKVG